MGRAAHVLHDVPAAPSSGVRAKPIPRTVLAARLDATMCATGAANTALAARLGVHESIVRGLRDGSRPLSVERLVAAGRIGAAVLRAAAELADPPARCNASPERHALSIARVAGWLAECVERGDVVAIRRVALQGRDGYEALLADLEAA